MRERVRSGMQLDGTIVAEVAWCCALPLLLLILLSLQLLFLRLCIWRCGPLIWGVTAHCGEV